MDVAQLRQKIKEKASREARASGNPNNSDIDRELSNNGVKRKPEDIPKQDVTERSGAITGGNVSSPFIPSTFATGGAYRIGSPSRPNIQHDRGFADFPKQEPSMSDYLALLKWKVMLEGAEALRSDLADASTAYQHFLDGEGQPKTFSYDRYVMNDNSGRLTLRNAILEAQHAAIDLWKSNGNPTNFSFTGPAIPCGSNSSSVQHSALRSNFPYPATENWQKAIGAHTIWLSGDVSVQKNSVNINHTEFKMNMTLHAEDQYNFNPGMKDIASGIPDDENGRFVVVGFAHGYRHTSMLSRRFSWKGFDLGVASMGLNIQMRQRKPNVR